MPCPLRWLTGASLIMSISCAVLPAQASPLTDGLPVAATVKQAAAVRAPWREQDPRVRVLGSQVYSNTPASGPQTLDLYLPRHPAGRRPLLVYVHGGGWSQGDARTAGAFVDFPELLRRLAQQGYAVASVNYRLSPAATFPAPLDDIKDAMAWLHDHARRYGIDPARTALWGSSAGGHLAALAALSPDRRYPAVKAWVSWFGVFDLAGLLDDPALRPIAQAAKTLLGCAATACTAQQLALASPQALLGAQAPAVLLIHGTADQVVPWQQSANLARALREQGAEVELMLIPNVGHSLVGISQALTEQANDAALDRTLDFLARHLQPDT